MIIYILFTKGTAWLLILNLKTGLNEILKLLESPSTLIIDFNA